jgi:hypothetical protein
MSEALILKIRVKALHLSLDTMKVHLQKVPDPREDLDKLLKHLEEIMAEVKLSRKQVNQVSTELGNRTTDPEAEALAEILDQADSKMVSSLKRLACSKSELDTLRARSFHIRESPFGDALEKAFDQQTAPLFSAVNDIETKLEALQDPDLAMLWSDFEIGVSGKSEAMFAEYIAFLGGLALRDAGFDAGISKLAQELIFSFKGNAFAIPTHRRAILEALTRIVRVRFPDWTIWSLPSIAFEFWRAVVRKELEDSMRANLRKRTHDIKDQVEERFCECLADAFATYVMGPAYAYFAIMLELNPMRPFAASTNLVAHEVRVESILTMLKLMNDLVKDEAPYKANLKQLTDAWAEAVAHAAIPSDEPDKKGTDPSANTPIPSDKSDKKDIERFEADKQRADVDKKRARILVNALWDTLSVSTSVPFTSDVWNESQLWVKNLIEGTVDEIKIPNGAELRHVLNAAWIARVAPTSSSKLTDNVNKLVQKVARHS